MKLLRRAKFARVDAAPRLAILRSLPLEFAFPSDIVKMDAGTSWEIPPRTPPLLAFSSLSGMNPPPIKFDLGNVVVTSTAVEALRAWGQTLPWLLARHQSGDWGELSDDLRSFNDQAIERRMNVISVYRTPAGKPLNVFTRADRTLTLVHLGLS